MRKTLTAAAALAPLWLAATGALAQTSITSGSATPVQTATTANGSPGDINLASGGTITLSGPGQAVWVNSPNVFTNTGGLIQSTDVNQAVGILITAAGGKDLGTTTSSATTSPCVAAATSSGTCVDNDGTINLKDSNSASVDSTTGSTQSPAAPNANGIAPFQRAGISLQPNGTAVWAGSITNDTSGVITVTGNGSFGILVGPSGQTNTSASQATTTIVSSAPTAPSTLITTGSITNLGSITVTGDNSAGIYTSQAIGGSLTTQGAIVATGQNTSAVVLGGDVQGRVGIYSALTATGYGAESRSVSTVIQQDIQNTANKTTGNEVEIGGAALVIGGNVGQGVYLGAAPANTASGSTADLDGDGIPDGNEGTATVTSFGYQPGMVIGAAGRNIVIGQLLLNPTETTDPTYGATGNQALPNNSVVINGSVSGQGIQDGVPATGLQIGAVAPNSALGVAGALGATAPVTVTEGTTGPSYALQQGAGVQSSGTVTLQGGLYIGTSGTVSATAYGADAIGMHILGGSTVPSITVAGTLSGTVNQPLPNATSGNPTPYNGSSYGLVIEQGANVNALDVSGALTATTNGDGSLNTCGGASCVNNAAAVIDYSGTLSKVTVSGSIIASLTPTATTLVPGGSVTALNLGYNTSGVSILMQQAPQTNTVAVTTNGTTTTTTYTSTGPLVANTTGLSVTQTSTPNSSTTVTTTTPAAPVITGDVYVGGGANSLDIEAGTFTGTLYVANPIYSGSTLLNPGVSAAGSTMSITMDSSGLAAANVTASGTTTTFVGANGAYPIFTGALVTPTNANGSLVTFAFNINKGSFIDTYPLLLNASSLHIGNGGLFSFAIDPAKKLGTGFSNTQLNVSGAATLDNGAQIGVNVVSNVTGSQTFTLINAAGGLTIAGSPATLATAVPYLFFGTTQQVGNALELTIREKTPAELGMNSAEASALPAIYAALPLNSSIQSAIFGQFDKGPFFKLYDQLLPSDYQGGLFRAASQAERTISRLTADPNQIENPTGSRGAWAQQFFIGADQGRGETLPFQAGGFGYAGGVETGGLGFGAVGLTGAFVAINESDPQSPSDERTSLSELELGVYWQGEIGGLTLDTRVAAGYDWFGGRRQFVETNSLNETVYSAQTKSNWNGYSLVGHFGAAYQIDLGSVFFLRPSVQGDYFRMSQNAYSEGPGGEAATQGFNMALGSRVGDDISATALMTFGAKYGRYVVWRPELSLGVRDVFDGTPGKVTGHFLNPNYATNQIATPTFTIDPTTITGPTGVARVKFKGSSEYYEVGIEAGAEVRSRYGEGDAKLSVRVLF